MAVVRVREMIFPSENNVPSKTDLIKFVFNWSVTTSSKPRDLQVNPIVVSTIETNTPPCTVSLTFVNSFLIGSFNLTLPGLASCNSSPTNSKKGFSQNPHE